MRCWIRIFNFEGSWISVYNLPKNKWEKVFILKNISILPLLKNELLQDQLEGRNSSLWNFQIKQSSFTISLAINSSPKKINQKIITQATKVVCIGKDWQNIGCQSLLIFYQCIHILWLVTILTNWFLPMIYLLLQMYCTYCQCFEKKRSFYQTLPSQLVKTFLSLLWRISNLLVNH